MSTPISQIMNKMRVRRSTITGNILRETQALRKFEISQIKKQIEILATFLPDFLIKIQHSKLNALHHFVGVFLFADISGFTALCEKYNKTGKGGTYRLTATLNAFVGAIVEVIYFYGGDVLKFSGDAFLALWKAEPDECLYRVIHQVIVCALFIQQHLGRFQTEVNVLLKVRLAISCGNMTFRVIGDRNNKHYVILGEAVNDVKKAERVSVSGDVVVAPNAWGHLSEESYEVTYSEGGNVKVWQCLYKPNERKQKAEYEEKEEIAKELCQEHIKHRLRLHGDQKDSITLPDSKITENFISSLPQRTVLHIATQRWLASDMKKFVIKPVQDQIEGKQPLEYLTELREVTIQFVNIIPTSTHSAKLAGVIDEAFQTVTNIVSKFRGVVNKVILFDKDIMILALFGLRGNKHELESQDALISGFQIFVEASKNDSIKSVSIGITNGLAYCGVVGHPLRREYTVIGAPVNKAARLMCAFENKVTCDYRTFKNSKLSSFYFQMQSTIKLKGIEDAGHIFEYNQNFHKPTYFKTSVPPIIGRTEELALIRGVVKRVQGLEEYSGICFYGKQKTGKTKILETAAMQFEREGCIVAAMVLTAASLHPYFCASRLYKQIFDKRAKLSENPRNLLNFPPELWDFKEILQKSHTDGSAERSKIVSLFQGICFIEDNERTIIFVDNVHFIDQQSLEVISAVVSETELKMFCAGDFEESTWDVQWKLSRTAKIKMLDLNPLNNDDIFALCCQFLKTKGISKKLVALIAKTCEGRPGWIQSCLLRLVNNGRIEVKFITAQSDTFDIYAFPNPNLLQLKHSNEADCTSKAGLISVAHLEASVNENSNELTLAAISLDLFDSFPPYEQLVIKIGAVVGEMFTRSLLFVMLKYPKEQIFASAIANLFKEEVLDCGTRYISTGSVASKTLCCDCYTDEHDRYNRRESAGFPSYAFCKLLHFKNKNLRSVAYELLPANQRKELHLHITDILENQNNSCPNCLRDDSTSIIRLRTYKQMMHHDTEQYPDYYDSYLPSNVKNIIRQNISKNVNSATSLFSPQYKRKLWDPSTCFCLEILTRVYADLIHHSEQAEHLPKRILYLMQYSVILLTLHEFNDCIPVLTEASELCMSDASNAEVGFTESCRKLYVSKIHLLLTEAHLRLGQLQTAKIHITISLRQYNVPLMAMKYKVPLMFLNRPRILYKTSYPFFKNQKRTLVQSDFGMCLTLLSTIFAGEGKWELAKKAAERSLSIFSHANANIRMLCDAYTNAIELYNMFGDVHECERLERSIGLNLLKKYTDNVIIELYAICKLISVLFKIRLMHGHVLTSIRVGYRALDLIIQIHAIYLQAEIIPTLASALLMSKRVENAVSVIKQLFNIANSIDDAVLIGYYAFCVELNLEASFVLEPVDKCAKYAEQYFEKQKNKEFYSDNENKIIIYLHVHFLRNCMWHDALKWKTLIKIDTRDISSYTMVSAMYKYVEGMLLTLVWNITSKKAFIELDQKRIETHLKYSNKLAKKWALFMPRYLLYMAYYKKILGKGKSAQRCLKQALAIARKQGNVLEECWIMQNESVWSLGGVNFGTDLKNIHWMKAQAYSSKQWSTILYGLPYEVIA